MFKVTIQCTNQDREVSIGIPELLASPDGKYWIPFPSMADTIYKAVEALVGHRHAPNVLARALSRSLHPTDDDLRRPLKQYIDNIDNED